MRKYLLYLLIASFALRAHAAINTNTFPLMAWDYVDDLPTLTAMRDCGITCIAFARPNFLRTCEKLGLQAIVFDENVTGNNWSVPYDGERARKNLGRLIKSSIKSPAVMGYHLKAEPHANEFGELAKAVAVVKEVAPGKWPYINLFPGDGDQYDKYIEDFVLTCKPTILSYDRYSFVEPQAIHPGFWSNLGQMRQHAVKHQLPFWNIVLSSTHWGYRELTEADLRLQAWGSLAYGIKGLAYYKFRSKELPIFNAPDLGNFRNGPLDQFGERTLTFNWLRNLNRQIQNLAPVYLKLRSDDVYHLGTVPARNHGPSSTNLVKAVNGDFVVGDFTHEDGTRYVLLVNKSLKESYPCQVEFNRPVKQVNYVSAITGQIRELTYPKYYFLAPGQGVLLKLDFD